MGTVIITKQAIIPKLPELKIENKPVSNNEIPGILRWITRQ